MSQIGLSLVSVLAAGSALAFDEARWAGPQIAMADYAYLAWPVVRAALLIAAVTVLIGRKSAVHGLINLPLAGALVLLAAVQWLHPRGWLALDIVLMIAAFAFLWRAYFQIHRRRSEIDWRLDLALEIPLALAGGWLTVAVSSALAEAIWTWTDVQDGTLATAWQAGLLVAMLFILGFGIEATKAHPAYVIAALWGLSAVAVSASDEQETTLMMVAIVVALITVALFFIERAMFRFRARPSQPADH